MHTLTSFKRKIKVGTKLLCVENTKHPRFNGQMRTVTKAQNNAICWTQECEPNRPYWTYWPKASDVREVSENQITFVINHHDPNNTVTLRILE